MHILSIHNNYQIRGGEDESRKAEELMLRANGHQVDIFEKNNDQISSINPLRLASKTVWSQEAYQTVTKILKEDSYNLIHVQNFFPLISPSVYYAAKNVGVPVVQTLRNYRLLCPNGLFFRNGKVCEDCLGQAIPFPGVIHACYRENHLASATVAAMLTTHRILNTWAEKIDIFITLTEFARQKFIEGGLPAEKIYVKPNFVDPDPGVGEGLGGYALYVGRLSVEKGLDTLLQAWNYLDGRLPLKIVGEGPLADKVIQHTQDLKNVEWLGRRSMQEVYELMGNATVLIFPSKWYETFGRVAVESFAKGTPVIAANIGAIAELVDHDRTGLRFSASNSEDLAKTVEWALNNPKEILRMRKEARLEYETKYTAPKNYERLMEIYQSF